MAYSPRHCAGYDHVAEPEIESTGLGGSRVSCFKGGRKIAAPCPRDPLPNRFSAVPTPARAADS